RGRVRNARLLPGQHVDRAIVMDVDGMPHGPDQTELVGDACVPGEMFANRHSRNRRRDRSENAPHLRRAIRLQVIGFELAHTAETVHKDDRSALVCFPLRTGREHIGEPDPAERQTAHAEEFAPIRRTTAWYREHWNPRWQGGSPGRDGGWSYCSQ